MAKRRATRANSADAGQAGGQIAGTASQAAGADQVTELDSISREELAVLLAQLQQPKEKKKGLLVQWGPLLLVIAAFAGYIYFTQGKPGPSPSPDDTEVVDSDLVKLAKKAFHSPQAAKEFAGACKATAEMVLADGESSNPPSLTKRSQAGEKLVAELARANVLLGIDADKTDLADFVIAAFDEEKEFPQTEGALTKADREKASVQFLKLAAAAMEVK
jgi:hypothetical protein